MGHESEGRDVHFSSRENFLKSRPRRMSSLERGVESGRERKIAFHPEVILLPSWRGYGGRRADSGRSYHFSGGDWPRGGWRMRTGCPLPLPTLTFLTSLLAALFARDRLCEAFLDRHCLYRLLLFLPICSLAAASLPNRNFFPFSSYLTMETNETLHTSSHPPFFQQQSQSLLLVNRPNSSRSIYLKLTLVLVVKRKEKRKKKRRVPRDGRFLRSNDLIAARLDGLQTGEIVARSPILVYPCTEHNRGTTQEGGQPLMRGAYWLDGGARPDANSNATEDVTLYSSSVHGCSTLRPRLCLSFPFLPLFDFSLLVQPFPLSFLPFFLPLFPSFSSLFSPSLLFLTRAHTYARDPRT